MGKKARIKKERALQPSRQEQKKLRGAQQILGDYTFKDTLTGAEIMFTGQQMAVLADHKRNASRLGREIGQERAVAFFLHWLETLEKEVPGVGPKTAAKIVEHFYKAYQLEKEADENAGK
jgi:hypothetical protein